MSRSVRALPIQAHMQALAHKVPAGFILLALVTTLLVLNADAQAHPGSPSPHLERTENGGAEYGDPKLEVSSTSIDFDLTWSPCENVWNEPIQVHVFAVDDYGTLDLDGAYLGDYDLGGNCTEPQPMHVSVIPEEWWNPAIFTSDTHEIRYTGYSGKIYLRARNQVVSCSQTSETQRISIGIGGAQPDGGSFSDSSVTISDDGSVAAFYSSAVNLVPEDDDGTFDVYVRDLASGTTELISRNSAGTKGNGDSINPAVSADGRFVVFESLADNLDPSDNNESSDVFMHDRQTDSTTRISLSGNGQEGNGDSAAPSVSRDGTRVAFGSVATNLVEGDTNGHDDVFVRDVASGATMRVSISGSGDEGDNASFFPHISANGERVAFVSFSSNLTQNGSTGRHVFARDIEAGTTELASLGSDGSALDGWGDDPMLSADGRYLVFEVEPSDPWSNPFDVDLYVRDLEDSTTEEILLPEAGGGTGIGHSPSISSLGRYIGFQSGDQLVEADENGHDDIYVYDRETGVVARASVGTQGQNPNNSSGEATLSGDGTLIGFGSLASNLVCEDDTFQNDVFVAGTGVPEPDGAGGDGDATDCDLYDTNCDFEDEEECATTRECLDEGEHPCAAPDLYCGEIVPPSLPLTLPTPEPPEGPQASKGQVLGAQAVPAPTPTPSPITDPPGCREVGRFCLTPVGQVLSMSVNVKMAHCGVNRSCSGSGEASVATRQTRLARRIVEMARKELGSGEIPDGMGYLPDVILLQEAWKYDDGKNDVRGIKTALKQVTGGQEGVDYGVAIQQERCRPEKSKRCRAQDVNSIDGKLKSKRKFKGATAILYNKWTMKKQGSPGRITSRWSPFMDVDSHLEGGDPGEELILCTEKQRRERFSALLVDLNGDGLLEAFDLDGDGEHDCRAASQRRQVYAGLVEKDDADPATDPQLVAAASVHLILDADLSEAANEVDIPEDLKAQWSQQVAERLQAKFGSLDPDAYLIGGDFNQQRCPYQEEEGATETTPPHESVPCTLEDTDPYVDDGRTEEGEKDFWKVLVNNEGFKDTIYEIHSVPDEEGETATQSMTDQYRDGSDAITGDDLERNKRIDLLFARLLDRVVLAASHDLTCGEDLDADPPSPGNCRQKSLPDRYSDHRIVWSLLGPIQSELPSAEPSPPPTPLPSISPPI